MSNLLNEISDSQKLYTSLISHQGKDFRLEIPCIDELYSNILNAVFDCPYESFASIPEMEFHDDLPDGVYKNKNQVIYVVKTIPKGTLKHHTFYVTSLFRDSKLSDSVSGKYITSFTLVENSTHIIPIGFTYLVMDLSKQDVLPFLAIKQSIPSDLDIYWVFFAMQNFQKNFFSEYDLNKVLDEKEKKVLQEKGYL